MQSSLLHLHDRHSTFSPDDNSHSLFPPGHKRMNSLQISTPTGSVFFTLSSIITKHQSFTDKHFARLKETLFTWVHFSHPSTTFHTQHQIRRLVLCKPIFIHRSFPYSGGAQHSGVRPHLATSDRLCGRAHISIV